MTPRPRLIPPFDEFYGTALELIPFERDAKFRVLDLGAGTRSLDSLCDNFGMTVSLKEKGVMPANEIVRWGQA